MEVGVLPRTRRLGFSLADRTPRPVNKQAVAGCIPLGQRFIYEHGGSLRRDRGFRPNCCGKSIVSVLGERTHTEA